MLPVINKWQVQIRKGYLDLCILTLIHSKERLYGFDLIEHLKDASLEVKEGTLYPLLNRMTSEGLLASVWETENVSGHPRKFYSLTNEGKKTLKEMQEIFELNFDKYSTLKIKEKDK